LTKFNKKIRGWCDGKSTDYLFCRAREGVGYSLPQGSENSAAQKMSVNRLDKLKSERFELEIRAVKEEKESRV
jgi:hypothetical protein